MSIPEDPVKFASFVSVSLPKDLSKLLLDEKVQHKFLEMLQATPLEKTKELVEKVTGAIHVEKLDHLETATLFEFLKAMPSNFKDEVLDRMLVDAIVHQGDEEVIQDLIDEGAKLDRIKDNPEIRKYLTSIDQTLREHPLIWAIRTRNDELAKILLNLGADANTKDKSGNSALLRTLVPKSSSENPYEIAELLLKCGADPNVTDSMGSSLLHGAARSEPDLVRLLISYGADPNIPDKIGRTPIYYSINMNNIDTLNALLSSPKTLVNIFDEYGETPLYLSMSLKRDPLKDPITDTLLIASDINCRNPKKNYESQLHLAVLEKNERVAKALLNKGINPNIVNVKGFTALNYASPEMAQVLKANGVDSRFSDEIVKRKRLAHVHGIGGSTEIKSEEVYLEGNIFKDSMNLAADYLKKFLAGNQNAKAVENITNATNSALPAESNKALIEANVKTAFDNIKNNLPVVLLSGTIDHAVSIVIHQGKVIVCNTGEGSEGIENSGKRNTGVVYELGQLDDLQLQNLLTKLLTLSSNIPEFKTMIQQSGLSRGLGSEITRIMQKGQKVGNCTFASSKTAIYALFVLEYGPEQGFKLHKEFGKFIKEESLKEYKSYHTDNHGQLDALYDYDLVMQIETKLFEKKVREVDRIISEYERDQRSQNVSYINKLTQELKTDNRSLINDNEQNKSKARYKTSAYNKLKSRLGHSELVIDSFYTRTRSAYNKWS